MKFIQNVRYQVNMGCCLDIWAIHGDCMERGPVITSKPVSFDRETQTFTTISGSIYKILSFGTSEEKFWDDIQKDIDSN